jgi:hypothetical protein
MPLIRSSSVQRQSIALFLATAGLVAGTVSCGHRPEAEKETHDQPSQQLTQPSTPAPTSGTKEGGEGGEGGEG